MKLFKSVFFLLFMYSFGGYAQCVAPYYDLTNQFYAYDNGEKQFLEPSAPTSVKVGRNYIAYINGNNARLRLYYAGKLYTVCENAADYWATDNWFVWKNYSQLGVLYNNELKTLEKLAQAEYWIGDSIITWMTSFNELKVFYGGQTRTLEAFPVEQKLQADGTTYYSNAKISDNIFAYVDAGGQFKAFYHGELKVLESYEPSMFMVDRDIVVYQDNSNNYKFFYKGQSYETSINTITRGRTGEGCFIYNNVNGELAVWTEGEESILAQDRPKSLLAKENVIAFTDKSSNFYVWYKGKTELLERYQPLSVVAYRDLVVYQDQDGRLKGYQYGKPVQVSDQIVTDYKLYNETVTYSLTPGDNSFWCRGTTNTLSQ